METKCLEILAGVYGYQIIWCPKYQCEINPVEGYWCILESNKFGSRLIIFILFYYLLVETKIQYREKSVNIKLWYRFWECLKTLAP